MRILPRSGFVQHGVQADVWAAAGFKVFPVTSSAARTPLNSALELNRKGSEYCN